MSQTWDKGKKGKSPMGWKPLTSQSTAKVSNSMLKRVRGQREDNVSFYPLFGENAMDVLLLFS